MNSLSICEPRYKNVMNEIKEKYPSDDFAEYTTATLLAGYIEVQNAILSVGTDANRVSRAASNIITALELYYIYTTRMN